jgi:hypothetical protein
MVEKIHSIIISCSQSAEYFSTTAECTADISHMVQLSVTIRYADVTMEIRAKIVVHKRELLIEIHWHFLCHAGAIL